MRIIRKVGVPIAKSITADKSILITNLKFYPLKNRNKIIRIIHSVKYMFFAN